MNEIDRRRIDIAVEMGSRSAEIAQNLMVSMSEFDERLVTLSEFIMQAYAMSSTLEFVVAEILAELGDGNREKFEKILVRSTALFESKVAESGKVQALQTSIDGLIAKAELAFAKREALG